MPQDTDLEAKLARTERELSETHDPMVGSASG
jgi:hypothetical protein